MGFFSFFFSRQYFFVQSIMVVLIGATLSWFIGSTVAENEKQSLVNRVENVAGVIDASAINELDGDDSDISKPSYEYLKTKLYKLAQINSDARWLYIMGYKSDIKKLFFFVDSVNPENKEDYSPPGQVYDESTDTQIENYKNGVSFAEGPYSDKWGRWVSAYAPIVSETGKVIAIVGIDVDAKRFLNDVSYAAIVPFIISIILALFLWIMHESRLRQKQDEMNNVKMEFASFMSHEIRGFVTKIKGSIRALLNEEFGLLTEEQRTYLSDVNNQSDDFGDLIEEFLDIGKLEQQSEIALKKGDYNLLDIIKGVVGDVGEALLKKRVSVVYEGNMKDRIYCECDNKKISQVFSNVLLNAIKYSPEKGVINIGYIDGNANHIIYIKDMGIGIPQGEEGKIFKKFFRASNARDIHSSGTGLGLYFSKLIVEKHDGRIWFETIEGRGTTFYISLPKRDY